MQTYEAIIKKAAKDLVFFDVGSNYGMQSLLFLACGLKTISFEPNPECCGYFLKLCEKNQLTPFLQRVALSDRSGRGELFFPKNENWLGTVVPSEKASLAPSRELKSLDIEMITLDSFVKKTQIIPDLIKMDVEGHEVNVLRGGNDTISKFHPVIIFECCSGNWRTLLWDQFQTLDYGIYELPFTKMPSKKELSEEAFKNYKGKNFIAFSREGLYRFSGAQKNGAASKSFGLKSRL